MRKKQGNKERERELFTQGEVFPYSCVPLRRFGNTPQAHALECPSLNRTHKYGNLPYNKCSILLPMWKIYFDCPKISTRVKKSFGVLLCFLPM